MRRLVVPLVSAATLVVLSAQVGPERVPPPVTFRGGVDIVDVDVSVLDHNRLPVRGLTAADFTVLEDGRPRPVVAFTSVDLPQKVRLPAPWMTDVAPDVLDNDVSREGRLVVILMDRSITPELLPPAVRYAEAVVDQLRPGDLAAVAYSTFGIPQNFTSDHQRLLAAIRQPIVGLPEGDDGSPADCFCGTCSLDTIGTIADALLPVRQRRKMLFVIGSNVSIQSAGPCGGALSGSRGRALRALEAANVTVYAFDPSGLETQAVAASTAGPPLNRSGAAALVRRANLSVLPSHTGGRLVLDPVRAADRVADVFRESDAYYVLGFQPAYPQAGSGFHDIRVKVNRRDVTVQARRGYYAAGTTSAGRGRRIPGVRPAGVSAVLQAAVAGLWPRTDMALTMNVLPVATPDLRSATVAVVLDVRADADPRTMPPAALADSGASADVTVLAGAFDRRGQALGYAQQTMAVRPRRAGTTASEYEVVTRLTLGPGRYEIRAAVEDAVRGRSGSVYGYVDVPDYAHTPVAMSGLLLEADPGRVGAPAGALGDLVPVAPTARRVFAPTDQVTGFVRIYQGLMRAMMPGYVVAEIRDDRDHSVFHQESRVLPAQFGDSRSMDFSVDVPMAQLRRGAYVLTVEARHGNDTARRDARFSVE
jgi:VWFA-related protein